MGSRLGTLEEEEEEVEEEQGGFLRAEAVGLYVEICGWKKLQRRENRVPDP